MTISRWDESLLPDPFSEEGETALERYSAAAYTDIDLSDFPLILQPRRAPPAFLPELADLLQAYTWTDQVPVAQQRQLLADSWFYHNYRTSQAVLTRFCETLSISCAHRWTEVAGRKTILHITVSDSPYLAINAVNRQWVTDTIRRLLGWPYMVDVEVSFHSPRRAELHIQAGSRSQHFIGF